MKSSNSIKKYSKNVKVAKAKSDSYQAQLSDLVSYLGKKNYKAFCYVYGIDTGDSKEMANFIYTLSDSEAKSILIRLTDES